MQIGSAGPVVMAATFYKPLLTYTYDDVTFTTCTNTQDFVSTVHWTTKLVSSENDLKWIGHLRLLDQVTLN